MYIISRENCGLVLEKEHDFSQMKPIFRALYRLIRELNFIKVNQGQIS